MEKIKLFIELTRLDKPIGFMLLFWPCIWGLTISYDFSKNLEKFFYFCVLFFLGSVLKYTIMFAAFGFLFNMLTVFALYLEEIFVARLIFGSCCLAMMISIIFFIREIQISTKALRLHISDMDQQFKE